MEHTIHKYLMTQSTDTDDDPSDNTKNAHVDDIIANDDGGSSNGDDPLLKLLFINGITVGSPEAKAIWGKIEAAAHSPEALQKAKAAGFATATGWYKGGPLRPGVNPGDTDFNYLVDKLHICDGYSLDTSVKVASSIRTRIYGR